MPSREAVYPTNLYEGGDLRGHLSEPELALEKCGLFGRMIRKQAEPTVGDILYLSPKGSWFFLGMIRRQFVTLKFSIDRIAGMASFCPRL